MAPPEYMGAKCNIITLFDLNNYEHGHSRRSARDRKDGRRSGRNAKKRRRKETPLKKRERTGQIISQQELKEKARQNGQNLIASIFFFVHRRAPYNFLPFLVYCKECSSKHLHTVRKTPDMRCHINHPSNCSQKEC